MPERTDTIYALATPAGRSAIAVIRISGPDAFQLPLLFGRPAITGRSMQAVLLRDRTGQPLDEVLLLSFAGPASPTGEDVLEIQCHGSEAVLAAIFRILAEADFMRAAEPGEFSRRTLLNGKKDLIEIEGLADLIEAETELQRQQALRQMQGGFSLPLSAWRERLAGLMGQLEALIDFADEELPPGLAKDLDQATAALAADLQDALAAPPVGELVRAGLRVVLAGPANAGKSTILNALAGRPAAIVSPQAGTTRDIVELRLDLRGVPVLLQDTAGWRQTADMVEQEGINRARAAASEADLLLIVLDVSHPGWPDQLAELQGWSENQHLIVFNKADLPIAAPDQLSAIHDDQKIVISMQADEAAGQLEQALAKRLIPANISQSSSLITRDRHRRALATAHQALIASQQQDLASAPELRAEYYRQAADALGRLAGQLDVEELLDHIFSRFCIGK